jgi:RNA polymerase sigma-70 factor, ECF subfamily
MSAQSIPSTVQSTPTPMENLESSASPFTNTTQDEDTALIGMLASSDRTCSEAALQIIYSRHSRHVYSLARKIVRDINAAEEIVQDTFVKLWKNAPMYDSSRGAMSVWLLTIAHHTCIDYVRRASKRPLVFLEQDEFESIADEGPGYQNTDIVMLEDAFKTLRPDEQVLIRLAYYEGLSHSQIVTQTHVPLGTIKTRLRAALIHLRHHLDPS